MTPVSSYRTVGSKYPILLLKESILFFQTKSNVNLIFKKRFKEQIRILKNEIPDYPDNS